MKTYGGFLPIELRKGEEYHNYQNMIRTNSARSAITLAVQLEKCNTVYIPIYLCNTVKDQLLKHKIHVELYNINENLLPIINEEDSRTIIEGKAFLLIVNYYGIIEMQTIQCLVSKYKNVIIDNTQAFFNNHVLGAYSVYSCRKFIGVSDGAYLVGVKCSSDIERELPQLLFDKKIDFLFSSFETGTDEAYLDFLDYEDRISEQGNLRMSQLTLAILKNVDYESIKIQRKDNYHYLCQKLNKINEINISENIEYPMVYPLLVKSESLRKTLISNHIYVAQWWRCCLEDPLTNEYEKYLSRYLIPIPIDQRYDIEDMEYIANKVFLALI